MSNDAAGFALRYGPLICSPNRAFDAGLRPDPFPDQAASLLPGLLAATRTGLTPASNDELQTKTRPRNDHLSITGRTGCRTTGRGQSGTAEEIQRAFDAGKPVHVYFSDAPVRVTNQVS
jgi:hypothetical protein